MDHTQDNAIELDSARFSQFERVVADELAIDASNVTAFRTESGELGAFVLVPEKLRRWVAIDAMAALVRECATRVIGLSPQVMLFGDADNAVGSDAVEGNRRERCAALWSARQLQGLAVYSDSLTVASDGQGADESAQPTEELVAAVIATWCEFLPGRSIGPDSEFFALGGSSILAAEMLFHLEGRLGIAIPTGALFEASTPRALARLVATLPSGDDVAGAIPVLDRTQRQSLSPAQARMRFLWELDQEGAAYNICGALRLLGKLDQPLLERCLLALSARHESLRTWFPEADGVPYQHVDTAAAPLTSEDVAGEDELRALLVTESMKPFALNAGPLARFRLFALSELEHVLAVTLHHSIADGASMNVLVRELTELYRAGGNAAALAPDPVQYLDYAAWQQQRLDAGEARRQLDYWLSHLGETRAALELPSDRTRPMQPTSNGARQAFALGAATAARLRALSEQLGVSQFTVLFAAFGVLLQRYSGQRDFCVGIPVENRPNSRVRGVVGCCVNTLVLRLSISSGETFSALLGRVKVDLHKAQAHQELPLDVLVDALQPQRSAAPSPLFQVMHNHQLRDLRGLDSLPGLTCSLVEISSPVARCDLSLSSEEDVNGSISLAFVYATDLFDAGRIERMSRHYVELLSSLTGAPEAPVAVHSLVDDQEQARLRNWSTSGDVDVTHAFVHEQIAERARTSPADVALVFGDDTLSYAELDRRTEQLAARLQSFGVGPNHLVGISLERSFELVIAVLGVLRSGAAYVPLEPTYPAGRLQMLAQDAQIRTVITAGTPDWCKEAGVMVLDAADGPRGPSSLAFTQMSGLDLSYVLYTSGTTGRPKPVGNTHRALAKRLAWMQREYGLSSSETLLHKTPLSFDVSVWEILWPLTVGARLVIAAPGDHRDPLQLIRLITQHRVSTVHFVPSLLTEFAALPDSAACTSLKRLFSGGESLSVALLQSIQRRLPGARIDNRYGPTEALINATYWQCTDAEAGSVPIGRPIPGTDVRVLDESMNTQLEGADGELYLTGECLARGYLGSPSRTAECFVPDPFATSPGQRMYRTGDQVRLRSDGALTFSGRKDQQVKVRGMRVELGELESALAALPYVRAAVATAVPGPSGELRLIGYVVADPWQPAAVGELERMLPPQLVPAQVICLDQLPRLASGKVDKRLLPEPKWETRSFVAPRDPLEHKLAEIWQQLLAVERVGLHDEFFSLGGHSLLATRVVARVRQEFDIELPLRDLFDSANLEAFAARVRDARDNERVNQQPPLVRVDRSGLLPLSLPQERMWFLWSLEPGSSAYNVAGAVTLRGRLDRKCLVDALRVLIERHEALRTIFPRVNGAPVQRVIVYPELPFRELDFSAFEPPRRDALLEHESTVEAEQPFDLEAGPVLRVVLVKLASDEHRLLVTLHHIVGEGWAMDVLAREWIALYHAFTRGERSPLTPLAVQYVDYAVWQRQWLSSGEGARQAEFWRKTLGTEHPVLELPADRPRPAVQSFRGDYHRFFVDAELTQAVRVFGVQHGVTLSMTVMTALFVLLHRYSGQRDLRIGYPIANRARPELEGLVGAFLNTQVLRCEVGEELSTRSLLSRVKIASLEAQAHQDLPFHRIVEVLAPERSAAHTPLFQVMCNVQRWEFQQQIRLDELTIQFIPNDARAAQFDLAFDVSEVNERIECAFSYSTDLFDLERVQNMARHWVQVLRQVVERPDVRVGELGLLATGESRALLAGARGPRRDVEGGGVHHAFERQVRLSPHATAVRMGDVALTYAELNARADRVGYWLHQRGVGPQTLVGLHLERSIDMVVGLLAALKSGAGCVPLDPEYPSVRIQHMVKDSGVELVLTHSSLAARLSAACEGQTLETWCFDSDSLEPQLEGVSWLTFDSSSDDVAYCIYTSGSTGQPKGVLNTHGGLLNRLRWMQSEIGLVAADRLLQKTSISFDVAFGEVLLPLVHGAELVLAPVGAQRDPREMGETIRRHQVTCVDLVPSQLSAFVAAGELGRCSSLRLLTVGGEALPWELALAVRNSSAVELYNMYGPTEASIDVSCWRFEATGEVGVSLGHPAWNTSLYLLDAAMNPVPRGVTGELYIGGAALARGYKQRPGMTASRFVPSPFAGEAGRRLYRTGDLAWSRRDGLLEFVGRIDEQVKVRGYRIELGEVQNRLLSCPDVQSAVVVVRELGATKQLIGYVVGERLAEHYESAIKQWVAQHLPQYMVPARIVRLAMLPLTVNGKVDLTALPTPTLEEGDDYAAPESEFERELAAIWTQLLGVPRIGIDANFFALGGDSIISLQVVSGARARGIELSARQIFQYQTIRELAGVARPVGAVQVAKNDGHGIDLANFTEADLRGLGLSPANVEDVYELTPMQRGMLFHSVFETDNAEYVSQLRVDIEGMDATRFERAWQTVVQRHAALRTSFVEIGDGQYAQVVHREVPVSLRQISLAGEEAAALERLAEEERYGLTLARAPLMRWLLVPLDATRTCFVWTHLHIVLDGWSASRLLGEVLECYAGSTPLQLPGNYRDHIAWLRQRDVVADERFWRERVRSLNEPSLLSRAMISGGQGYGEWKQAWSKAETERMQSYGKQQRVTLNTLVQGAWLLLLSKYTGEETVCFGATVSGRTAEVVGSESLIGLFINTVAVVERVEGEREVGDWLRELQASNAELREHEQTALNEVQRYWGRGGQALFDTLLVFENYPVDRALRQGAGSGLRFGAITSVDQTHYALSLEVNVADGELAIQHGFQREQLSEDSVYEIAARLRHLLTEMVNTPQRRVSQVPLLTTEEQSAMLELGRGGPAAVGFTSVVEAFEEQVKKTPGARAVKQGEGSWTYGELNSRANRVAERLRERGVGEGELVGLCVERSLEMVAGLLGVLKAGAAYVALDPEYPEERLVYMLQDSGARLLVTHGASSSLLSKGASKGVEDWARASGVEVCELSPELLEGDGETCSDLGLAIGAAQGAYCIYTSGSTGKPKGVIGTHGGVLNRLEWLQSELSLTEADRVLQKTSLSFDVSVGEILWPLLNGGQLVLGSSGVQRDMGRLAREIVSEGITLVDLVPGQLGVLATTEGLKECESLRCVTVGGEGLPLETAKAFRARHGAELVNMYGPTEASIDVTYWRYEESREVGTAPLGRAMSNTSVYVLDGELLPVGVGMRGEVYIGGAGLARGYHGRAGLTAERFIPSPFGSGERLYRTGDVGRYGADGVLSYLGRVDDQVKVRGYRIELGEVESQLLGHRQVRAAAAAVKQVGAARQLVGYVVGASEGLDVAELRAWLVERVPEYMVPAQLIALTELPLLANGKLDRKALPEPGIESKGEAPETELEVALAVIWSEVLGAPTVGVSDNFFELGGDSILSLQLVSRARAAGIEFTPKELFEQQTIRALGRVARFDASRERRGVRRVRERPQGDVALTAIQRRFLAEPLGAKHHFNQALLLKPKSAVDSAILEQALDAVVAHHDVLRLRYEQNADGTWRQWYAEPVDVGRALLWQRTVATEAEQTSVCTEAQRSLDAGVGPLIQAALLARWDGTQRLLVVVHHLVVDGVSWRVLMEDLQVAYAQLSTTGSVTLADATASFGEWTHALSEYAQAGARDQELAYYRAHVEAGSKLRFPCERPEVIPVVGDSEELRLSLSVERTRQLLRDAPGAYRTQVNDLLLTALARALCLWTGETKAWIELETHGRADAISPLDVSRTVGWFTSLYPVLLSPGDITIADLQDTALGESICAIKEQLRAVPSAGVGYSALEAFAQSTAVAFGRRPRVTFNYLGQLDAGSSSGMWELTSESVGESQDPKTPLLNWVTFNAEVLGGQLRVSVSYSRHMYQRAQVEQLAAGFCEQLDRLVQHCVLPTSRGATASDFPLSGLTQGELTGFGLDFAEVEDIYALSPMQLGMVFHSLAGSAGDYVSQLRVKLTGVDHARFENAWREVVKRHEVLRTSFVEASNGKYVQVVRRQVPVVVRTSSGAGIDENQLEQLAEQERSGLALDVAPLMRWLLVELDGGQGWFIWTHHHVLLDGWSASQLMGEVVELYEGSPSRAKRGVFKDHIAWLQKRDASRDESFWKGQLRQLATPTLVANTLRASSSGAGRGSVEQRLSSEDTSALSRFAQHQRVTVNTLVQTAWTIVLQRYTRQESVCFGATVSGRSSTANDSESTIGLFINTLPVILELKPSTKVGEALRLVQAHNLTLREYEHTPLYDVQRWAGRAGHALFDSLLVFENYPVDRALRDRSGAQLSFGDIATVDQTNYALTLEASLGESGLALVLNFNQAEFYEADLGRMLGHVVRVLEQLGTNAETPIGEIGLVTLGEARHSDDWNATRVEFDSHVSLQRAFEHQVERTPDALGLIFGECRLTYGELNARANRLAHYLQSCGVGPDTLVGVCAERSSELVVALYAVLKAGGAYVPLDPDYPAERLRYMVQDSGVKLVLCQERLIGRLPEGGVRVWCLDQPDSALDGWSSANPEAGTLGDDLAYCIYTSGSTGRPKGAVNVHSAVLNRIAWMQAEYSLSPADRVLQKTPYSFDVSVWEFLWPLFYGATLVVAAPGAHKDPAALRSTITEHAITTVHFVPSMLRAFVESGELPACATLRQVMCSGEALPADLVTAFIDKSDAELHNLYGPTEAAIDVSYWRCREPSRSASVPIGRPIANVTLHVLDPELQRAGLGVAGEIYIGGVGLARGYRVKPALTAERFVPSPFGRGERLYRTGDVGRQLEGGVIEYLGRADDQVKVRGYRIELGEIEAKLLEYPSVTAAAVTVKNLGQAKQLVGYVVGAQLDTSGLRHWLAQRLPEYMVPAHVVQLIELPLTASGKLDRKALPEPSVLQTEYVAPTTELEQTLAGIWAELLGVPEVSVGANFFELGGDSILSLQVVSRARARGVTITARQLFELQTVRELARVATFTARSPGESTVHPSESNLGLGALERGELQTQLEAGGLRLADVEDVYPLTAMQEGIVFHSRFGEQPDLYVNQLNVEVEGLDGARLESAWQAVVGRHDILRTSIWDVGGKPVQVVFSQAKVEVRRLQASGLHAGEGAIIAREERRGLDLQSAPLMRWLLVELGGGKQQLVWTHHHVLLDGWSSAQLLGEVLEEYAGRSRAQQSARYRDHVSWLRSRDVTGDEDYWRSRLMRLNAPTYLSQCLGRGNGTGFAELHETWSGAETERLQSYGKQQRVTLNTLVQGAWLLLLSKYTGEETVCFGATVSGRSAEVVGSESLIGLFINTVAVVERVEGEREVGDWLRELQASNAELREHEQTALNEVQRYWGRGGQALFDTLLVFENYPVEHALEQGASSGLKFGPLSSINETNYALTIEVSVGRSGLNLSLGYQRSAIDERDVQRLSGQLRRILGEFIAVPQRRLREIELLSAEEQSAMLELGRGGPAAVGFTSVVEAFEEQVKKTPGARAVKQGEGSWMYGELNSRANRVAERLRERGVGEGELVGLCVERSLEMVAGLLGVLKAGAAYVALDPEYPEERLAYMLQDSGARLLVTHGASSSLSSKSASKGVEDWARASGVEVCELSPELLEGDGETCSDLGLAIGAAQGVYCIYTSGSTGKPKGVMGTHGGVLNRLEWLQSELSLTEADRVLQKTSLSFDVSVGEILWPLLNGGQLVLGSSGVQRDMGRLAQEIVSEGITLVDLVPGQLGVLATTEGLKECESLRCVTVGGEGLPLETAKAFRARHGAELVNMYGPTEASIDVTYWRYEESREVGTAPLGRAMSNTIVYVLDGELLPVGPGMRGEVYIGGAGLARGYHGRAGLTAERFIPSPFGSGERLYRTGDVGRYGADGVLSYLGRVDDQVKVRGYRIELGEVESQLLGHRQVRAAAAAVKQVGAARQLVGYVVGASEGLDVAELRAWLVERVPEYMVPAQLILLTELPLLANGKLDRKALPEPGITTAEHVDAQTPTERVLMEIWGELLAAPRVSVEANFFELGGDSILSLQVVSRARSRGIEITPKQVFEQQTIRGVARVAILTSQAASPTIQERASGEVALTAIQRRFLDEPNGEKHHFNQALLLKPRRAVISEVLDEAIHAVARHHDAFRLRFEQSADGTWRQFYADQVCVDQSLLWQRSVATEAEQLALCTEAQRSLDLRAGPLLRAVLIRRWDGGERLLVVVHHLVIDGVSWRVLMEDVQTAYAQLSVATAAELPEFTAHFGQWVETLIAHANSEAGIAESAYYEEQAVQATNLGLSYLGEQVGCVADADEFAFAMSTDRTRQLLRDAPGAYRTQVNDLLLAGLARAVCTWSSTSAAWIELESHGRASSISHLDVGRTLGWFTCVYPVLLWPTMGKSAKSLAETIGAVKEQLRAVPSAGVGYQALEAYGDAGLREQLRTRPNITFNYLGQIDAGQGEGGLWEISSEGVGDSQSADTPLQNAITFNAEVAGGQLRVSIGYSRKLYEPAHVQKLGLQFKAELEALIEHCLKPTSRGATASDFPLSQLTQPQLQSLNLDFGEVADIYPATPMQQGMVFHSLYAPEDDVYLNQQVLRVRNLNATRFEMAWHATTARHEALRTGFVRSAGQHGLLQIVYRHAVSDVSEVDCRGDNDPHATVRLARKERERGLDLARLPLQRVLLVRTGESEHQLIWTYHHAVLDGWSAARFIEEVLAHYALQPVGQSPRGFRDYVAWYAAQDRALTERFWREELKQLPAPTQLSRALAKPRANGGGEKVSSEWLKARTDELRSFAAQQRVTLNTLVQAAWALLLQQHTGQSVVCFGATVAGRPTELLGVEEMLGLFINTLPVIVRAQSTASVGDWLREIQHKNVQLRQFEHTPLSDVQRWAGSAKASLFDTLLVFENYPVDTLLGSRKAIDVEFDFVSSVEQTNYPLTLEVNSEDGLVLHYGFKVDAFDAVQVRQIAARFDQLLSRLIESGERAVASISMLTIEDERQLRRWSNATSQSVPFTSLATTIEARVSETPEAIAVSCGGATLSYRELNARANGLARRLRARGIGADVLVGVCMGRSVDLVVALLAVLKAGGAYLPLDPEYPAERLRYLIEDSQLRLLLTDGVSNVALSEVECERLCMGAIDEVAKAPLDCANLELPVHPEHAAYCIYTSGSTGRPKGAILRHAGLVNHMAWFANSFGAGASTRVLQKTPISFDASVWEFWLPLMVGGCLVVATSSEARDPNEMLGAVEREGVNVLQLVPQLLDILLRLDVAKGTFSRLEHLFCGGEALPATLVQELHTIRPGLLKNLYGPTEATIDATWWSCDPRTDGGGVPIGRPIDSLEAWVLDPRLSPVAPEVTGELWLAGTGLARGYHRRAALTAERFVPHPSSAQPGARLYRTGDLARWRADGVLEYVGRVDHQVKVRGYRIELGEIEARLREHPALRDATVIARQLAGVQQLVAYVVPRAGHTVSEIELRNYLSADLPEYMVPARGVLLSELPLTAHGKVDRAALPEPERIAVGYRAPETVLGRALAGVWQEVLKVERIGQDDNFFELGGDSLLAMQVVARVALQLGIHVPLRCLFDAASLAAFEVATQTEGRSATGTEVSLSQENES